ncbi:glycosyltransferase family 2 protein [Aquaspirillum serpens]|uniref:glycosyltransferase family 2 protein n=1 Tax=Aquaspirillum serpens TaxID=190 RepID=UPI00068CA29C|nr:glycosyltransferase [Aquaspirillum serpens]
MKTKIDVIVPIYRGLEETKSCIRSIVNSEIKTSFIKHLLLINDCSPEPLLTDWLRELTLAEVELILIENQENLGFVATVNKGMSLSSESDIVLLNSDTEVANDWLDRLMNVAYSDKKIGTVTPFSNNATICSYPKFCQDNDLPNHLGVDQLLIN